jgi:hypothetical protein
MQTLIIAAHINEESGRISAARVQNPPNRQVPGFQIDLPGLVSICVYMPAGLPARRKDQIRVESHVRRYALQLLGVGE